MIKVMIERRIDADLAEPYRQTANKMMQLAMQIDGFISGESLQDAANPCHRYVFASYRSQLDWQRWYNSDERRLQLDQLRPLLLDDEKITILEHL